jgi:ABC-type sugar transport system substrate-binding protein
MAQSPVTMGRWGVRIALMALTKQSIPDEVFTPSISITKDNADTVDISAIRQPKGWKPPI